MLQSFCFRLKRTLDAYKPKWCKSHEDWSLYIFSPRNRWVVFSTLCLVTMSYVVSTQLCFCCRFRMFCQRIISHKIFDHVVLVFIFLNCITIALERPDIQPNSRVSFIIILFWSLWPQLLLKFINHLFFMKQDHNSHNYSLAIFSQKQYVYLLNSHCSRLLTVPLF